MKLLKIKLPNGYKMLEKGFEINFLTKTRVNKAQPNSDLFELADGFYYPIETAFIGKNSSGKTTTLKAIEIAASLIHAGRVSSEVEIPEGGLSFEIVFLGGAMIYRYKGTFVDGSALAAPFCIIESESLEKAPLKSVKKKDLSDIYFRKVADFIPNEGGDTSSVWRYASFTRQHAWFLDASCENAISRFSMMLPPETMEKLIHLFDDSIEYIRAFPEEGGKSFEFKRIGGVPSIVSLKFLNEHLSGGTIRGIALYGYAILTFAQGGELIVDEIESNFNKNLIGNLFLMFNDPSINKAKGTLVYSTHYAELLDETDRTDNINVLHRNGASITIKNVCSDYKCRTDMLKSAMFDQNAFDNQLNYDRLLDLKEELRNDHFGL